MHTTAESTYLPALAKPHERDGVGRELGTVLVDLVALALTGSQVRWAVVGPATPSLRTQLAELVAEWRAMADTVAERAMVLGHAVNAEAAAVAAGSSLSAVGPGPIEDHVAVHEVTHRVATVAERVRSRMELLGDVDGVSRDVLAAVVRDLERHVWLLRVQSGARS